MSPDVMLMILKIAAVFIAVSFVVFWVGLVWWVSQDVLTRTKDKIIISAAVALTAILGPVGILIYLVVRPRQTLKERYGEMMEQEMMLQASAVTICPTCERIAQNDFLACPHCGTILKKPCIECGKLLAMNWDHCPFCGAGQQPTPSIPMTESVTPETNTVEVTVAESQIYQLSPAPVAAPRSNGKLYDKSRPVLEALRSLFAPVGQSIIMTETEITSNETEENTSSKRPAAKKVAASNSKKQTSTPAKKASNKKDRSGAKKR